MDAPRRAAASSIDDGGGVNCSISIYLADVKQEDLCNDDDSIVIM